MTKYEFRSLTYATFFKSQSYILIWVSGLAGELVSQRDMFIVLHFVPLIILKPALGFQFTLQWIWHSLFCRIWPLIIIHKFTKTCWKEDGEIYISVSSVLSSYSPYHIVGHRELISDGLLFSCSISWGLRVYSPKFNLSFSWYITLQICCLPWCFDTKMINDFEIPELCALMEFTISWLPYIAFVIKLLTAKVWSDMVILKYT